MLDNLYTLWGAVRFTIAMSWDQYWADKKLKETRNDTLIKMLNVV